MASVLSGGIGIGLAQIHRPSVSGSRITKRPSAEADRTADSATTASIKVSTRMTLREPGRRSQATSTGSDPRVRMCSFFRKRSIPSAPARKSYVAPNDSMDAVASIRRMARFDYLTMLGKLGLAPITPDRPYLHGATGPLRGARSLFLGNPTASRLSTNALDTRVVQLGTALQVGMQEMEDSLCNWQKSPSQLRVYRG